MDWKKFHSECVLHLPVYSRPVFIRVRKQLAVTTTFKHQKSDLVKEGYNIDVIKDDAIYYYSSKDGSVVLMDRTIYDGINCGDIKL
jgi:hypothetical protein